MSYRDLPLDSQLLVDQVIPEFKGQLGQNFLDLLQKPGGLCGALQKLPIPGVPQISCRTPELDMLVQRYQAVQQTLRQYSNNFEQLRQQIVNIIPGTAQNAGPAAWSQLTPRVYARMTGGKFYGETGTLEMRVLPSSQATGGNAVAQGTQNDKADVPLQAMLAYPNAANMQGLGWTIEPSTPSGDCAGTAPPADQSGWQVLTVIPAPPSLGKVYAVSDNPSPSHQLIVEENLGLSVESTDLWGLKSASGSVALSSTSEGVEASVDLTNIERTGGVSGYPNVWFGWNAFGNGELSSSDLPLPVIVSNAQNFWLMASYAVSPPLFAPYDFAYDVFFSQPSEGKKHAWGNSAPAGDLEIMLWLDYGNGIRDWMAGDWETVNLATIQNGRCSASSWQLHIEHPIVSGSTEATVVFFMLANPASKPGQPIGVNLSEAITVAQQALAKRDKSWAGLPNYWLNSVSLGSEFNPSSGSAKYSWNLSHFALLWPQHTVSPQANTGTNPPIAQPRVHAVPQTETPGSAASTGPTATAPAQAAQGGVVPDSSIVAGVSAALAQNSLVRSRNILVNSLNGVVTLTGAVDSQFERETAERIAASQAGVRQITNHLTVLAVQPVPKQTPRTSPGTSTRHTSTNPATAGVTVASVTATASPLPVSPGGECTISGLVRDASGGPVAGATVSVTISLGSSPLRTISSTSGSDGTYSASFTGPSRVSQVDITVTVRGSKAVAKMSAKVAVAPQAQTKSMSNNQSPGTNASAARSNIRSVDFKNFDYPSALQGKVIHVTNGLWEGESESDLSQCFGVGEIIYGDLRGDGHEQAVIVASSYCPANQATDEIFVYSMSPQEPILLQLLPSKPSDKKEIDWNKITDVRIANRQILVTFGQGECHACVDWLVTAKFAWNGTRFVRTGSLVRKRAPNQQ